MRCEHLFTTLAVTIIPVEKGGREGVRGEGESALDFFSSDQGLFLFN